MSTPLSKLQRDAVEHLRARRLAVWAGHEQALAGSSLRDLVLPAVRRQIALSRDGTPEALCERFAAARAASEAA